MIIFLYSQLIFDVNFNLCFFPWCHASENQLPGRSPFQYYKQSILDLGFFITMIPPPLKGWWRWFTYSSSNWFCLYLLILSCLLYIYIGLHGDCSAISFRHEFDSNVYIKFMMQTIFIICSQRFSISANTDIISWSYWILRYAQSTI